eukprot:TRINITY_DN4527_c0_g1_i1.p1 TRINITY_DN4527_c0_g1~~TRINITY_DN4527_c0_g1_i1.p1  ORF type:complete len:170 (-),score=19.22 TRINITY_DN4527_c0_g1_i1:6-515(-)
MSNPNPPFSSREFYEILGVSRDASQEKIRSAYRRKTILLHPDKTGGATTQQFQMVNEAHQVLSNPSTRRDYDLFLEHFSWSQFSSLLTTVVGGLILESQVQGHLLFLNLGLKNHPWIAPFGRWSFFLISAPLILKAYTPTPNFPSNFIPYSALIPVSYTHLMLPTICSV